MLHAYYSPNKYCKFATIIILLLLIKKLLLNFHVKPSRIKFGYLKNKEILKIIIQIRDIRSSIRQL